ncbi:heterokaryon incompatibility protein-domain-containing protein [Cercophora samala]|uniref:Heterokaryon incompatibility protein-domain-containing protein n=1 Tax=Cercophora samala TaxID=330535 RepID=A0AA39ZID6_9PEZI|nr:heterokaryon incompatibility protein-domain-containing protein [Cercophora samala]
MATPTKLCVFCRCVEPIAQPCAALPTSKAIELIAPLQAHEETLILGLQQQPSTLCQRCAAFDIVRVFKDSNPLDHTQPEYHALDYRHSSRKYEMNFGELASLILSPSCPLCRLIFRIFPRVGLGSTDVMLKLVPFRSYVQREGWNTFPAQLRANPAIFLGVNSESASIITEREPRPLGGEVHRFGYRTGESMALAATTRSGNAKYLDRFVDVSSFSGVLEDCIKNHPATCQVTASPELSLTRMIDVIDRKVVPYPHHCDYFALSYVWGGVMPASDGLENKTLPNTIEDAIAVTRKLGRRYLWVDALCIDQTPNPTPIQRAEKEKQLKIMDQIYSSATLTLVAVSGDNSNAGLPGVTRPRTHQVRETIAGHTFFTVPPTAGEEIAASTWSTRAWTLQESMLSVRYLYFTSTQVEFACAGHKVPESLEITKSVPSWPQSMPGRFKSIDLVLSQWKQAPDDLLGSMYWGIVHNYTARRMTNDEDSLNALAGLIAVLEKKAPAAVCVWGLPLKAFPRFLGWMHLCEGGTPKRREAFPSWSWAGWEGEAALVEVLEMSREERRLKFRDLTCDMEIQYLGANGSQIEVEGWRVCLEIRTEPLSEALFPGTHKMMGYVKERNFDHNNTIPSGGYECLVVERFAYRTSRDGPVFQKVFMIVLEFGRVGSGVAKRKTFITLNTVAGVDFMSLGPVKERVLLE